MRFDNLKPSKKNKHDRFFTIEEIHLGALKINEIVDRISKEHPDWDYHISKYEFSYGTRPVFYFTQEGKTKCRIKMYGTCRIEFL